MSWQDTLANRDDWNEAKRQLGQYARRMTYVPASSNPEHPFAKLVTKDCDNINLDRETTYCEICGRKHGRYYTLKGWIPAFPRKMDTGVEVPGLEINRAVNRFPELPPRERVGSDHSSDGADVTDDELFDWSDKELIPEQVPEQVPEKRPMSKPQKESTRERLKRLYPEIYQD